MKKEQKIRFIKELCEKRERLASSRLKSAQAAHETAQENVAMAHVNLEKSQDKWNAVLEEVHQLNFENEDPLLGILQYNSKMDRANIAVLSTTLSVELAKHAVNKTEKRIATSLDESRQQKRRLQKYEKLDKDLAGKARLSKSLAQEAAIEEVAQLARKLK